MVMAEGKIFKKAIVENIEQICGCVRFVGERAFEEDDGNYPSVERYWDRGIVDSTISARGGSWANTVDDVHAAGDGDREAWNTT